jgi:hypothetical protein
MAKGCEDSGIALYGTGQFVVVGEKEVTQMNRISFFM